MTDEPQRTAEEWRLERDLSYAHDARRCAEARYGEQLARSNTLAEEIKQLKATPWWWINPNLVVACGVVVLVFVAALSFASCQVKETCLNKVGVAADCSKVTVLRGWP